MNKSLLTSKTFWLNILGAVVPIASSGLVPVKYSVSVLAVANIGMRLITDQPIESILPKSNDSSK